MAITYSGGIITVTNQTVSFEDIYQASISGVWGVVAKNGKQYMFDAAIVVGDGTTVANLIDTDKQVQMNVRQTTHVVKPGTTNFLHVRDNSNLKLGTLVDLSSKTVKDGCSIKFKPNSVTISIEFLSVKSDCNLELYGCDISISDTSTGIIRHEAENASKLFRVFGGVTEPELQNRTWGAGTAQGIPDIFNVQIPAANLGFRLQGGSITNVFVSGAQLGAVGADAGMAITARDLVARNCANIYRAYSANIHTFLIDADSDTWNIQWEGTNTNKLYKQWSHNFSSNSGTVGLAFALFDNADTEIFSEVTDGSGVVSEQIVSEGYYKSSNGNTLTTSNPHKLIIRKYGQRFIEQVREVVAKVIEGVTDESNPFVVVNSATASGYNVQFDGVTGLITNTGNHTQQEVYDAGQYWASQSVNFKYDVPLETFDGVNFLLGTGWTIDTTNLFSSDGATITITGAKVESTATSGNSTELYDTTKSWGIDEFKDRIVWLRDSNATAKILSNTATKLVVSAFVKYTEANGVTAYTPTGSTPYSISYNFQDMIDDFIEGVTKSGDFSYTLNARLKLQTNGCFHDTSISLAQETDLELPIDLPVGSLLQWGFLDENDSTSGGISWILNSTYVKIGGSNVIDNFSTTGACGTFKMYATTVAVTAPNAVRGSFWRLYTGASQIVDWKDVLFNTYHGGSRIQGTDSRVEAVKYIDASGTAGPINFVGSIGLASNIVVQNSQYAFYWYLEYGEVIVRGLKSTDVVDTIVIVDFLTIAGDLVLIDYKGDPITLDVSVGGGSSNKIQEVYSYAPTTVNNTTSANLQNVGFYAEDSSGNEVVNKLSDSQGQFTESLLRKGKHALNSSFVLETPHIVKFRHYDYEFEEFLHTSDAPFKSNVGFNSEPYTVADSATAAGYSSLFTLDWVNEIITVVGVGATPQKLYDYVHFESTQSANLQYDPLITSNGFDYTTNSQIVVEVGADFTIDPFIEKIVSTVDITVRSALINKGTLNIDGSVVTLGATTYSTATWFENLFDGHQWQNDPIHNEGTVNLTGGNLSLRNMLVMEGIWVVEESIMTMTLSSNGPDLENQIRPNSATLTVNGLTTYGALLVFLQPADFIGYRPVATPRALTSFDNSFVFRNYDPTGVTTDYIPYVTSSATLYSSYLVNALAGTAGLTGLADAANNHLGYLHIQSEVQFSIIDNSSIPIEDAAVYIKKFDNGLRPPAYPIDNDISVSTDILGQVQITNLLALLYRDNTGDPNPFVMDYHNEDNGDSDEYRVLFMAYGLLPLVTPINFKGIDVKHPSIRLSIPDIGTTETNTTLVSAYTGIAINPVLKKVFVTQSVTKEQLYDFIKLYEVNNPNVFWDNNEASIITTSDRTNYSLHTDWDLSISLQITGGINLTGNVEQVGVFDISNHNIIGQWTFTTAGTYIITDSTINEVVNTSGGAVIINAVNSSFTTNTGPNITINNAVPLTVIVRNTAGGLIQDAEISLFKVSDDSWVIDDKTDVNGEFNGIWNYISDVPVYGWVRKMSGSPYYQQSALGGSIIISGYTVNVQLISDE